MSDLAFAAALWAGLLQSAPVAVPIDLGPAEPDAPASEGPEPADDGPDDERVVIDILVPPPGRAAPSEAEVRQCEEDIDAATVTGEIIVCRQLGDDQSFYYSGSRDAARRRYAEETAFANDILAPDVAGAGIFRGPATVGGLCFIPPCPDDPALIIDVEALPEAPEGSDADRIARGLPPADDAEGLDEADLRRARRALGLEPDPKSASNATPNSGPEE